ncbi:MAG: flippase-like domain-containing protein [Flavobacteriaceae bacterium]|nr:flippase-like domain-containing protein [Flavobacteriaceae bacterium]
MKPKLKKQFVTTIKILVSLGLIALVFSKLDWSGVRLILKSANPIYFAGAVIFFLISQLISIFRFNIFMRKVGVRLSFEANSKLYLLGMFYNFFLPGGVGGDAYKAFALSKSHKKSLKKIGQVVFVERFLGIVAIGFVLGLLILFLKTEYSYFWNLGIAFCGIISTIIILKLIIRFLHTYKKRVYIGFFYSVLIQIAQLICIFCILKSFGIDDNYLIYILLFLTSSILSVISFAGLGIREAVFFYGAHLFNFDPDISAFVALSFSLITAMISFFGIIYLFIPIEIKNKSPK